MGFYIGKEVVERMIGTWSPNLVDTFIIWARFIAVFIVLYFLAIVIYWFNRTGKIPPLRVVWRSMIQLAKWFPKILVHRIKIVPSRIRRKKVDAYPALNGHHTVMKKNTKKKKEK